MVADFPMKVGEIYRFTQSSEGRMISGVVYSHNSSVSRIFTNVGARPLPGCDDPCNEFVRDIIHLTGNVFLGTNGYFKLDDVITVIDILWGDPNKSHEQWSRLQTALFDRGAPRAWSTLYSNSPFISTRDAILPILVLSERFGLSWIFFPRNHLQWERLEGQSLGNRYTKVYFTNVVTEEKFSLFS